MNDILWLDRTMQERTCRLRRCRFWVIVSISLTLSHSSQHIPYYAANPPLKPTMIYCILYHFKSPKKMDSPSLPSPVLFPPTYWGNPRHSCHTSRRTTTEPDTRSRWSRCHRWRMTADCVVPVEPEPMLEPFFDWNIRVFWFKYWYLVGKFTIGWTD